ncbi:hypothetical protein HAX54_043280 [Datura stramonium]|uniref:DUF4094 domain-containing protein n=1 Tax=Datura stramonium TaxID=4076 RepID=A0ABS8W4B2_DATST|nr:hypothetical protein [Datura stramonium]
MLFFMKNIVKAANNRVLPADEKKLNSGGLVRVPVSSSALWIPNSKMRSRKLPISGKTIMLLCIASFMGGSLFASRIWIQPNSQMNTDLVIPTMYNNEKLRKISCECDLKCKLAERNSRDIMGEVMKTHQAIQSLDKSISTLEMELAIAQTRKTVSQNAKSNRASNHNIPNKAFIVIGINTSFSSKKIRDSLRETWMPKGDKLRMLDKEKQIVVRAILHRYANEDISLGSWLIGLEVEHVHECSMCCGTPLDCEWKAKGGKMCVALFDWSCSGVCKSVERMKDVHHSCGESDAAVWTVANAL